MSVGRVIRTQHPVGHGFFHSTRIEQDDGTLVAEIVYDCGNTYEAPVALEAAIDQFLALDRPDRTIALLFVSHYHQDHIKGLARLLDPQTGVRPDAIVLPLVSALDKLITFVQNRKDRVPGEEAITFAIESDPIAELGALADNSVVVAKSDGIALRAESGITQPIEVQREVEGLDDRDRNWTMTGPTGFVEGVGNVIPDSTSFVVTSPDGEVVWQFAPYVDEVTIDDDSSFIEELAAQLQPPYDGLTADEIGPKLEDPQFVRSLLTEQPDQLDAAYEAFLKARKISNMNRTSLSLLAVPVTPVDGRLGWEFGGESRSSTQRLGWLATGDAELASSGRRHALFTHYDKLLDAVHTLAPPHHGSNENFHEELVTVIKPRLGVVGARSDMPKAGTPGIGSKCYDSFANHKLPLHAVSATSGPLIETIELAG